MGTDFALACGDCLEFIDLHKWSIVEEAGCSLVRYHDRYGKADRTQSDSSPAYQIQWVRQLSNQPLVPLTAKQLIDDGLKDFIPHQPYIEKLVPFVHSFITFHKTHFLFLTCDYGEHPWDFGEPRYLEWKEIQAECSYSGQFLPRNLIEDFGFTKWSEVLAYYSEHESWFLSEQMKEERELLKQVFDRGTSL